MGSIWSCIWSCRDIKKEEELELDLNVVTDLNEIQNDKMPTLITQRNQLEIGIVNLMAKGITIRQCKINLNDEKIDAVLKTYQDDGSKNRKNFEREVEIFRNLSGRSQYFLDYYGSFVDEISENQTKVPCLNIVYEFCPRTLNDLIELKIQRKSTFSPEELYKIIRDLLEAFSSLAMLKIPHQDIRPENIFVTEDDNLKIGNFNVTGKKAGYDGTFATTQDHEVLGSESYMAPELRKAQMKNENHVKYRRERADVFSLGLVFYQIATLDNIWKFNEDPELIKKISKNIRLEWVKKLINGMLDFDYQKRFSFKEALGCITVQSTTVGS